MPRIEHGGAPFRSDVANHANRGNPRVAARTGCVARICSPSPSRTVQTCWWHRSVLLSGFSWRTKAGWKVGECGVFRQALGVAQHVGWNPVGEVLLQDAVNPGRGVLLTDRCEPVDRKTVRDADQGTPDATVDERHLPIHQPRPDDIGRVSEGIDRDEDRMTRWVTPPAPTDPFTGDKFRHVRQRSVCRLEEHSVFDERRHRIHRPKSAPRVRSAWPASPTCRAAAADLDGGPRRTGNGQFVRPLPSCASATPDEEGQNG